jgi:hypothetical protein
MDNYEIKMNNPKYNQRLQHKVFIVKVLTLSLNNEFSEVESMIDDGEESDNV